MSPNELATTISNLERRRQNPYYRLMSIFAYAVKRNHERSASYLPPLPPSLASYVLENKVLSHGSLTDTWMKVTNLYESLCEIVMRQVEVKKVMRMGHSVKFYKRPKVYSAQGQRENLIDAKMVLLLQNEIGQILGRRLTRSENHDETGSLLLEVKSQFAVDGDHCFDSDNVSAKRKLIGKTYGGTVQVKQDPFHVITRLSERSEIETGSAPTDMKIPLRDTLSRIRVKELSCTEAEWKGLIESNVQHIARGDLHVESNVYTEGGGPPVRITSTDQLEGFHSGLKKLLGRDVRAEVGLRILDKEHDTAETPI